MKWTKFYGNGKKCQVNETINETINEKIFIS